MAQQRYCSVCGVPIAKRKYKCPRCLHDAKMERQRQSRLQRRLQRQLERAAEKAEEIAFKARQQVTQHPAKKPAERKITACDGCKYYKSLSGMMGLKCCHYAMETGRLRKIPASECYKHEGTPYTPGKRKVVK